MTGLFSIKCSTISHAATRCHTLPHTATCCQTVTHAIGGTHIARFSLDNLGKRFECREHDGYKMFLELSQPDVLTGLEIINSVSIIFTEFAISPLIKK